MKKLVSFIMFVAVVLTMQLSHADLRGDHFTKSGHFPVNPINDDDEVYILGDRCSGALNPYDADGNNIARMQYTCVQHFDYLPWEGRYPVDELEVIITNNDVNWTCNMVTSNYDAANDNYNNNEYVSNDFIAVYTAVPKVTGGYRVTFSAECWNGVKQ